MNCLRPRREWGGRPRCRLRLGRRARIPRIPWVCTPRKARPQGASRSGDASAWRFHQSVLPLQSSQNAAHHRNRNQQLLRRSRTASLSLPQRENCNRNPKTFPPKEKAPRRLTALARAMAALFQRGQIVRIMTALPTIRRLPADAEVAAGCARPSRSDHRNPSRPTASELRGLAPPRFRPVQRQSPGENYIPRFQIECSQSCFDAGTRGLRPSENTGQLLRRTSIEWKPGGLCGGPTTAPPVEGSANSSPPGLTFRTGTQVVALDVVVTDSRGHVAKGLQQGDFSVGKDGKPQALRHFREYSPEHEPDQPGGGRSEAGDVS